ncbi:hypothetical protein KTE24_06910 [Burkholderia gladioli]|uniref:hypothetical protein n=1 Tax=Burkholderia gladioli TaxID=28095 RepID=UPI00163E6BEC|nr:hypothetical protein [Burkholderia gladioli]MBU9320387.1 hypothetical protein [Burkholderia gladioli]
MAASTAFADIGYRVEDGDLGYLGASHSSFVSHRPPSVAHIRATPIGDAALERIYRVLNTSGRSRNAAGRNRPGQSTTPAGLGAC